MSRAHKQRAAVTAVAGLALACVAFAQEPDGGKESSAKKRRPVTTDVSAFEMLAPEKLAERTTVVAATRGLKPPPPVPLAPFLGKTYDTRPTLMWSTRSESVVLTVRDQHGAEVIREPVTGDSYRLPDHAALSAGQSYQWSVRAPRSEESDLSELRVVDGAERAAVESSLGDSTLQGLEGELERARTLAAHGLWYDCVAAYSDLIASHPDRAELYEERGAVFSQLVRTQNQAAQDLARAEELRGAARP
jgi:hypothetical protein